MTRHHTSFRLSDPAARKLTELAEAYGNKTTAIELAIDGLYTREKEKPMDTLQELVAIAISDLQDWLEDNPDLPDRYEQAQEIIHEVADTNTPMWYHAALTIAADNIADIGLAQCECHLEGPDHNPARMAQLNIYDHIALKLHEELERVMPS